MLNRTTSKIESFSHAHFSPQKSEKQSSFALEICRGQTQHPQRPISKERFLIGSGSNCDLQLGGEGIPILLAILEIDDGLLWLDAVSPQPEVRVNGEVQQYVQLNESDQIQAGPFTFVIRKINPAISNQKNALPELESVDQAAMESLSAEELVDLMEQDRQLVQNFETGRELGAEALLEQVAKRTSELVGELEQGMKLDDGKQISVPVNQKVDSSLLREVSAVLESLYEFSDDLEKRSERLSYREANYVEAATTMVDTQQRLAEQLEILVDQVLQVKQKTSEPGYRSDRKIA